MTAVRTITRVQDADDWGVSGASDGDPLVYDASTGGVKKGSSGGATDGWTAAGETWTYASADAPTFTFTVAADVTAKYSPGMRLKLTQTTVKYFIVTAVSAFTGGNTTITVYGGTDYTLANASITSPYYSIAKAPFGFPLDPTKWTVTMTDTSDRNQSSPAQNTVYNMGSLSISVPIGMWNLDFAVVFDAAMSIGHPAICKAALSTANNSFSDPDLTAVVWAVDAGTPRVIFTMTRNKVVSIAAKTTYYLVASVNATGGSSLDFRGDIDTTLVRAVCSYL